jgi:hypothetical protein
MSSSWSVYNLDIFKTSWLNGDTMYKYFRYIGYAKELSGEIYRHDDKGNVECYRPDMATFNNGSDWDECYFRPKDMSSFEFEPANAEDIFTELI